MTTDDILKFEISRELIVEAGGKGDDEQVQRILDLCKGNPWDCGKMYAILEASEDAK